MDFGVQDGFYKLLAHSPMTESCSTREARFQVGLGGAEWKTSSTRLNINEDMPCAVKKKLQQCFKGLMFFVS